MTPQDTDVNQAIVPNMPGATISNVVIRGAGTTSDVAVTKNGATLFSGQVNGYGASVPFSLSVTVAAGDAVEFTVGVGSNGTYNNDSTGLAATIVQQVGSADVEWLVADQLGTPRMVVDKTGSLAGVK